MRTAGESNDIPKRRPFAFLRNDCDAPNTFFLGGPISRTLETGNGLSARQLIEAALWFAAATGAVELLLLAAKKWVFGHPLYKSIQIVWMLPLAYVLVFGVVSIGLIAAGRVIPAARKPVVIGGVLGFLSAYAALAVFHVQLREYARIILALGIAVQAARWMRHGSARFHRMARTSLPVFMVLIAAATVAVNAVRYVQERRALAALPSAAPGLPNVLLIVLDTVRAASLSLYGYERPTTPGLERLAERGVVFDRAFSTASWTRTSHASMFTGLFPHEMQTDWNVPLERGPLTLAEYFSERGYLTTAFVANRNHTGPESGLPRGFQRYRVYKPTLGEAFAAFSLCRLLPLSARGVVCHAKRLGRKSADDVNEEFLEWMAGRDASRPYFAFLNYMEGHAPYEPPEPYASSFATTTRRTFLTKLLDALRLSGDDRSADERTRDWRQSQRDAYDGAIAYLDLRLNDLLDALEADGSLANTLVIVTSDHGEEFWEHGDTQHAKTLYVESIHVPFLMVLPDRIPAGRRVGESVTLRDLPATLSHLLEGRPGRFPGRTLVPLWTEAPDSAREPYRVLSELDPSRGGQLRSVVRRGVHFLNTTRGQSEEAYDLTIDPTEQRNIVGTLSPAERDVFRDIVQRSIEQSVVRSRPRN